MNIAIKTLFLASICGVSLGIGHAAEPSSFWQSIKNPATLEQLKSFVATKEAQAQSAAKTDGKGMPAEYKTFFNAADKGDWLTVSNLFWVIGNENGGLAKFYTNKVDMKFRGTRWEAVREIWGAYAAFADGDEKYSELFANEIISSIPPGSIYFGGTDPGRFIITALQKSQIIGEPFFTLTQNALADGSYLDYLRSMYGNEIYIPTTEDSDRCFEDYYSDAEARYKEHRLKQKGEDASISNGHVQFSGKIAVMEINARIARVIFEKEPNRQFFVEESIPLDWMYPYLEPHGLIFKLNHKPLEKLSDIIVERDHDYWSRLVSPMIGNWLNDETTLSDVEAFVQKVFLRHDLSNFQGDSIFEKNGYSRFAFAKERAAIAGLYAWRADHSNDEGEKRRMEGEADFAFRQAWALNPESREIVLRYANFLMEAPRTDDAIMVVKTYLPMDTCDDEASNVLSNLKQYKRQGDEWAEYTNKMAAMENEVRVNPTNYSNLLSLTSYYLQAQQTNRATALLRPMISRPTTPPDVLRRAAEIFAQTGDYLDLEIVLKKLLAAMPDSPEAPYDVARLESLLKKYDDAIKYLRIAIRLSDQRLKSEPTALDIRKAARGEANFNSIRNRSDFQKLVLP
jgi:tetratricopeptide (TPR) repeat protein